MQHIDVNHSLLEFQHKAGKRGSLFQRNNSQPGLEVVQSNDGLIPTQAGLEVVKPEDSSPDTTHDADSASNKDAPLAVTQRKYCGLSRKMFILVSIVSSILVVGAAIGAGVGATVGKHSSSETAPVSNYPGCVNSTVYTSSTNLQFLQFCNTDFHIGGNGTGFHTSARVLNTVSGVSFQACMEACAKYGEYRSGSTPGVVGTCQSVTFVEKAEVCFINNNTAVYGPHDGEHAIPKKNATVQSANVLS